MISFDGFIDTYYAFDFNGPEKKERAYTTQPLRHNEANINLIHGGINLKSENYRGRFALQGGNSVTANTQLESNRSLGHIQESYLGYKISENVWLDAGIYLGHIGMESWISKDNFNYGRSLLLDYVPYYTLGTRLSYQPDSDSLYEFHIMNGWQNISETNAAKSVGIKIQKKFPGHVFTYNNHLGDEKIYRNSKNRFRTYHNFILGMDLNANWKTLLSIDIGTQSQDNNDGTNLWEAGAVTLQQKLDEKNFMGYRLECYLDPHQANVQTATPNGFQVYSSSINLDHHYSSKLLWRTELRGYQSRDKIFPKKNEGHRLDGLAVTSLSFSI